jgi:hypothetical protein
MSITYLLRTLNRGTELEILRVAKLDKPIHQALQKSWDNDNSFDAGKTTSRSHTYSRRNLMTQYGVKMGP